MNLLLSEIETINLKNEFATFSIHYFSDILLTTRRICVRRLKIENCSKARVSRISSLAILETYPLAYTAVYCLYTQCFEFLERFALKSFKFDKLARAWEARKNISHLEIQKNKLVFLTMIICRLSLLLT